MIIIRRRTRTRTRTRRTRRIRTRRTRTRRTTRTTTTTITGGIDCIQASSQDHIKNPHCHKHIAHDLRSHVERRLATREIKGAASIHQEIR